MRNLRLIGSILALGALFAGCSSAFIDEGGGTGGGSFDDFADDSGIGVGVTTGGGTCVGYLDANAPTILNVVLRNDTPQPIFVPAYCTGDPVIGIHPDPSDGGVSWAFDRTCLQTCGDLQSAGREPCGGECAPRSIVIAPGGQAISQWAMSGLTPPLSMPGACWFEGMPDGDCQILVKPPNTTTFAFDATAFASCTGACACDESGLCDGEATGAQASAPLVGVDSDTVEIVFDACAFGCG